MVVDRSFCTFEQDVDILFNIKTVCVHSCRNIIVNEGLFDQIRVDHGKEFVLMLYVQESLAHCRTNTNRDPHRQTESKKVLKYFK